MQSSWRRHASATHRSVPFFACRLLHLIVIPSPTCGYLDKTKTGALCRHALLKASCTKHRASVAQPNVTSYARSSCRPRPLPARRRRRSRQRTGRQRSPRCGTRSGRWPRRSPRRARRRPKRRLPRRRLRNSRWARGGMHDIRKSVSNVCSPCACNATCMCEGRTLTSPVAHRPCLRIGRSTLDDPDSFNVQQVDVLYCRRSYVA